MKRYLVVLSVVLAATVGVGTALSAHHSFAATYHEGQSITIEGELVQFLFRNPHSFVHINVTEKDGTVRRHAAEWGGASQLGWRGGRPHFRQTRDPAQPSHGRDARTRGQR